MKKQNNEPIRWKEELDNEEINITLTEEEVIVLHNFTKKLLATRKAKIEEFETLCKYCKKPIMMRNYGFGSWKPYGLKKGKLHKCREGKMAFKEQKQLRIKVSDLMGE